MIERRIFSALQTRLSQIPAVVLLGPRQVGKTTLALAIAEQQRSVYLDLESEQDRAKLAEPELYLRDHRDDLIILDEIHRAPGLLPVLRGLIDRGRQSGGQQSHYLLLGSASPDLLRQSGETLAGRVSYIELHPFDVLEAPASTSDPANDRLWVRGGFPQSFLSASDAHSLHWRRDFIRTYLERDIPQFAARIAAETLRRFWSMLAYRQGSLLNAAELARSLGMDVKTIAGYIDLLSDLLLVRRLPPWHANLGKRLVKSPKVYVRDSGVLHALLAIDGKETLLSHPVLGTSWEGFVIENLLSIASEAATGYFYRTSAGAEIDLLLHFPDGRLWAIEIKRSLTPRPDRGFHLACSDIQVNGRFVVYPGEESYRISEGVEAVSLGDLARRLIEQIG